MTDVDDLAQLIVRLIIGLTVSLAAGLVTYVVGVWALKLVVAFALQAPTP